jgi:hypothetical protein
MVIVLADSVALVTAVDMLDVVVGGACRLSAGITVVVIGASEIEIETDIVVTTECTKKDKLVKQLLYTNNAPHL